MSDETTGGPPPSNGRDEDLIERARRQVEGLPASDEALATMPGMPPPDSFPGYELVREIHRGGQGAVYLAIQKTTKRKVAIKVMHGGPHVGSSGRARFEREVQILGQMNHPNIVRILDSGTTPDGGFFYVMDYVSGRTLDEHVAAAKPTIQEVLRLFVKICDGANAAHLKGVIHRDLKPANVRVDARGEPVIVDFGLAKIAVPDVTVESRPQLMSITGQFIGSLPWASPEQAEGNPSMIDVRTDVYSLGVMLYQMLTGRFPYDVVGNMRDVLDNILRATPARPSTVRRQINDEVETIVLKCLSKERERRYQSAGEIGRDIGHYLAGEPIEAKRDSGWYVISKTLGRYRPQVAVAAAFVVLLIAWGATASIQWRLQSEARRGEAQQKEAAKKEADRAGTAETQLAERNQRLDSEVATRRLLQAFMGAVWDTATPEIAQGRTFTSLDAVDAAAAKIEESLGPDEELSAEVHETIGEVYLRIMQPEKAAPHLDKALEFRRRSLGAAHPDTLAVLHHLALATRNQQGLAAAEKMMREVVAGYTAIPDFGPGHPRTLEARFDLARVLDAQSDQAKKADAAEIYRSLLEALRGSPGQTTSLIAALTSYADLTKGTSAETARVARPFITEAMDLVNGNPDPKQGRLYAKTRLVYARVHDLLGADPAEIERAYAAAITEYTRLMGESNRETLGVRSLYATFLRQRERFEEAEAQWRVLVQAVTSGVVPPDDPLVSQFQGRHGECLLAMGRLDDAEPILITSYDAFVKRDKNSLGSKLARQRLRDLYTQKGQPDKAVLYAEPAPGG